MKNILFLFAVFPSGALFSQTISGKIENAKGERIPFANVVIKDSVNAINIKEFVIAQNGYYSVTPSKAYQQLVIEVSANKYQKEIFVFDRFDATKNYTRNFILVKDTIMQLKNVVITAKTPSFRIKGDTVSYLVSAYSDGTERKVEDIIKKLPGIDVNENTGEIKYKGKTVETVTLDGDNLFDSNYAIGTKNINADIIEQVQAIENYLNNPLLKGLEGRNKMALNLILKKKKTDYSGGIGLGLGVLGSKTAADASTNILGVSKKYKSFATVSYNNIGINNAPFDYFSYNPSIKQPTEEGLLAIKYIPEIYFNTEIDAKRSRVNNSFFSSYNMVFKVGERLNLKNNLYYFDDRLIAKQSNITSNNINGQQFTTTDYFSIVKRPIQIRNDLEAKYNVSKKSLLEYSIQYKRENSNIFNDLLQNNIASFNTLLTTKDNYIRQTITYTNRISEKKAVQFIAKHAFNNLPQQFSLEPAVFESLTYKTNNQISWFKKSNFVLQANLLGSDNTKGKYAMTVGAQFNKIDFNSELKGITTGQETSITRFQNNFNYLQKNIYLDGNYKFQFKRLGIAPAIILTSLVQRLTDNASTKVKDTSNIFIEPSFSVGYKIGNYSRLLITTAYNQKPFSEDYFVENPVYLSNRGIRANEISFQVQKSKSLSIFYNINNLYKQFSLNIGTIYSENKGNYFSNLSIQQNTTNSVYFFLPETNKFLTFNFMIEKYVPFLQGTIRLKNDYFRLSYKNIVNNSSLRNNSVQTLTNELFFKTAFDCKINFDNTFQYKLLQSENEGGFQFFNQSINNKFQIIIKPTKRFFLLFSTDYFLPKVSKTKQNYFFFDIDMRYQTKNKNYNIRLKARNISNNKYLNHFTTNDYSTSNFQTNLLPRHLILSLSRNF